MRIFSGIQPTGDKHLGNLIGGFRQYAPTQEQGEGFFCIVDLHSISVEYDPDDFREKTLDLAAMLFATGLDPERSTVFAQSHVPAHAEAAWLLGSVASFGQLRRMTQFKEKSEQREFVSSALFTYPVLMAGDILLYQTDIVPIGDDQRQHLELTRDIAVRFNSRFGETFKVPDGVYPEVGARIMDLQEPERKMSTTGGHAAGNGQAPRRPRHGPEEVQLGGHRLGARGPPRRRQAGRDEPDRHRLLAHGRARERDRGALRRLRLRAVQDRRRRRRRRGAAADPGALPRAALRPGRAAAPARPRRREGAQGLRADADEMFERMGFVKSEAGRYFGAARPRGL